MKKIVFTLLCSLMLISLTAQTNSVTLKDGTGSVISSHNSIASAYGAIPASLAQAYIIELNTNYTGANETFPITFTVKSGASSTNTITLRPEASVTAVSIAGTLTGGSLLILNDADFIRIDGRSGGVGTAKALTIDNQGTSTSSYGIHLQNGACNNIIRYCNISGYRSASSGGEGIRVGASASTPTGNSDNTFEFLRFEGSRYNFHSVGTAANPNDNINIFGCEFVNIAFCGWWQGAGTGTVRIDSCSFYGLVPSGTSGTGVFAILSDSQSDTILITRSKIYNLDNGSYSTDVFGMSFRSFNAGSVLRISNNFISLMAPNTTSNLVYGISLGFVSANNPLDAEIYHNTIRIGGSATGGTAGNVGSAGFFLDDSHAGNVIKGMNNMFINERTGGNEQHLSAALITFLGTITSDYNVFRSATTDFGRLGTTVFNDFTSYAAAITPNDVNSNDSIVHFVSNNDLHLTGASIGNINIKGIAIPGITTDIDNQLRSFPYKGADEAGSGCSGSPQSEFISDTLATVPCEGDSMIQFVNWKPADNPALLTVQWQSSLDDITYFDIPGATNDTLAFVFELNKWYRYIVKCPASGDSTISITSKYIVVPAPVAGNIVSMVTGSKKIHFTAGGSVGTAFTWKFGDGQESTGSWDTITHTYADTGTYVVTLIAKNSCGVDSITYSFAVEGGTGIRSNISNNNVIVFPNPVNHILTIQAEENDLIYSIDVYDLRGKLLLSRSNLETGDVKLNTSALAGGTYILTVNSSNGISQHRIQVAK